MTRKPFSEPRRKKSSDAGELVPQAGARPRSKRRMLLLATGVAATVVLVGLMSTFRTVDGQGLFGQNRSAAPIFVGSETCAQCHQAEADLWYRSQHKLAMAHANETSVLADFNDTSFDYFGVHSRFYRKDGKYFVETDGPDGKLAEFEIKYTFGVDPLAATR